MTKSLSDYRLYIENALEELELPSQPLNLYAPLSYFLSIGGKRMRPILALMGTELFATDYKQAKHAALAVELFHNFTLIHDDIMDEAPLRRGKETVHKKWNQDIAILSGDTLMIEAYKQLCNYPPAILAKLLPLFNDTAIKVCEGQQWDMDFEQLKEVTITAYLKMIEYKTAVLLGCSLQMGAIIGGASGNDAKDLYDFGVNLGVAFQIQDDILDVYADQSKFGKQVGGDILANKKTYLLSIALEDSNATQKKRFEDLFLEKDARVKVTGVKALYAELDIKRKATEKMNSFHKIALEKLEQIAVLDVNKNPLRELAVFLLGREY